MTTSELNGLIHDAEYVRADDGERLYVQRWRPSGGEPRAVFVISHGLAEHSDCYLPFVEYFAARGAAIYAHDHRGFGRSGGRRGHVSHYERYVEDLRALVQRARGENPGLPVVLVGHSMGGTIALLFALRHASVDIAIFSAPALIVGLPIPAWKRALGLTMSRLYPTYTDTAVLRAELLTRDLEIQQATREDTLRHGSRTARLFTEMFVRGPRDVYARASALRIPYLVLHGSEDPLVPVEASQRLYDTATAPPREIRIYPGLRHELFREVERAQVFADVAAWLDGQRIALNPDPRGVSV